MESNGSLQKFLNKTFSVAMVTMMLGFVGFVAFLIDKVLRGHGLDYYISGMGYKLNYLGVLILVALMPLLVLVVWLVAWYQGRDERDFKEKYLNKDDESHNKAN